MLIAVMTAVVLTAEPFKAASSGVSITGLPPERTELYSELVAQQMTVTGVKVITPKQIAAILGMERQKALLGCSSEATSCVAEIASALGVDGVVQGEAAKLDSGGFQVSLKVLWARDGRPLTVFSGRAADEGGLLDLMSKGASLMAKDLTTGDWVRLTVSPAQHVVAPFSPLLPTGVALLGVAAAGAVIGTIGLLRAGSIANELQSPDKMFISRGEAQAIANDGKGMQTMAIVAFTIGGIALVGGALLTVLGLPSAPEGTVKPVAGFGPHGASFGLVGVFQ